MSRISWQMCDIFEVSNCIRDKATLSCVSVNSSCGSTKKKKKKTGVILLLLSPIFSSLIIIDLLTSLLLLQLKMSAHPFAQYVDGCQEIGLVAFMFFFELSFSYVSSSISFYVSLANLFSIISFPYLLITRDIQDEGEARI